MKVCVRFGISLKNNRNQTAISVWIKLRFNLSLVLEWEVDKSSLIEKHICLRYLPSMSLFSRSLSSCNILSVTSKMLEKHVAKMTCFVSQNTAFHFKKRKEVGPQMYFIPNDCLDFHEV